MELSKQLKVIDRKFAYNTGKLPGFGDGTSPSADSENLRLWMEKLQDVNENSISPYQMMKDNLNGKSFIGSDFDNAIQKGSGYVSDDPYVKNPKLEAPAAKQLKIGNIQTAASALPGFVGNMVGSWTNYESKDEILAKYHPMQASIGGIGFNKLTKNKNGKLPGYSFGNVAGATASGASMGSVAGPWGAVIGGAVGLVGSTIGEIISGDKQRRHEEEVAERVKSYNNGERGGAISKAMLLYNQKTYGDQYTQSLIPHAIGKLPKYNNGKPVGEPTWTVEGPVFNGPKAKPNAKVEDNEIAYNKTKGVYTDIDGLPNDGSYAHLSNSDGILSARPGVAGISPADLFRTTGNIDLAEQYMVASNAAKGKKMYKCGKLPRHAEGWLGNGIPAMLGSIAGLSQYIDAKNSRPYYPRTYVANPYEGEALSTLAGLRINPYPITRELRDAEARSSRAIDIAGGLSGSQRTAARLAALNTTQGNISKLLSDIQQQNNAYRANYAQAAINAGQQARTARMAANQWDLDYYSKAHAARNKGIQTGIANMLAQIQLYQANEFKRRQFNETMDLYRADQKQRNELNQWVRNWYANQPTRGIGADPAVGSLVNPSYTTWNTDDWNRYNLARGVIGAPAFPLINRRQS